MPKAIATRMSVGASGLRIATLLAKIRTPSKASDQARAWRPALRHWSVHSAAPIVTSRVPSRRFQRRPGGKPYSWEVARGAAIKAMPDAALNAPSARAPHVTVRRFCGTESGFGVAEIRGITASYLSAFRSAAPAGTVQPSAGLA